MHFNCDSKVPDVGTGYTSIYIIPNNHTLPGFEGSEGNLVAAVVAAAVAVVVVAAVVVAAVVVAAAVACSHEPVVLLIPSVVPVDTGK